VAPLSMEVKGASELYFSLFCHFSQAFTTLMACGKRAGFALSVSFRKNEKRKATEKRCENSDLGV
jgi:hypothetical protein